MRRYVCFGCACVSSCTLVAMRDLSTRTQGERPLHYAVLNKSVRVPMMRRLLDLGANVDVQVSSRCVCGDVCAYICVRVCARVCACVIVECAIGQRWRDAAALRGVLVSQRSRRIVVVSLVFNRDHAL
jgi:hypothetical protein